MHCLRKIIPGLLIMLFLLPAEGALFLTAGNALETVQAETSKKYDPKESRGRYFSSRLFCERYRNGGLKSITANQSGNRDQPVASCNPHCCANNTFFLTPFSPCTALMLRI